MDSPHLSPRERAAVLWAEHVTKNTARSREDVYQEARRHFSEAELVELTLMVGFFNMFNRLTDSLRLPVEAPEEVRKIQRSVRLDPERVQGYYGALLGAWPRDFPRPDAQAP